MSSDDVQALMGSLFSGAQFTEYETGLTVASAPATSSNNYLEAFSMTAKGVGDAGRSIGAGRTAQAEGKIAGRIARVEAAREKMKGRRLASTAKAIGGAQGNPEGSPLLAELSILQAAHNDVNAKLYEGNINKYHAREKAKAAYMKAPADLLEGILGATTSRAGKSLLGKKYD